jgi:two-component system response regulator YesN
MNLLRVLIVDDEYWVRMGIIKNVDWQSLGLQVIAEVENGKKALEIIQEESIDILITDIHMPIMNGIQLIEETRKINQDISIIILSGYTEFEYARKALALDVIEYIVKPIIKEDIVEVLKNAIKRVNSIYNNKMESEKIKEEKSEIKLFDSQKKLTYFFLGIDNREYRVTPYFEETGLLTPNSTIVIMSIIIDNFYNIVKEKYDYEYEYLSISILNSIKLILKNTDNILIIKNVLKDDEIILVYHQKLSESDWKSETIKIASLIAEKTKALFNIIIYIGIGNNYEQVNGIKKSYNESYEAARTAIMMKSNKIIMAKDIKETMLQKEAFNEIETLLVNIELGNKQAAISSTNEFFEHLLSISPVNIRELTRILINTLVKIDIVLKKLGFSINEMQNYDSLYNLILYDDFNFELLHKRFVDIINDIIDFSANQKKGYYMDVIPEIINYINENYNKGINLGSVALRFFLTPSYLSRIFKNFTGHNFNKYLTELKMKKASELLIENKESRLNDIALYLGYENPEYFLKKFKQFYNCTPTQYKAKKL